MTSLENCVPKLTTTLVAHRGASFDAPENTLAAQQLAWEQNADAVETDVYSSKDGRLVCFHDRHLRRITGRDALVDELSLEELKQLDAGTWKAPKFANERIPLLEEQLALVPAGKHMVIELKMGAEIVPELQQVISRHCNVMVTLISFDSEILKAVRRTLPGYPTLLIVDYSAQDQNPPTLDEIIAIAKSGGFTGVDLQQFWPLNMSDGQKFRDANLQLHVWTVDDPIVAKHWIELGATSITTNRPGYLRAELAF